jgi:hypothetical protein
MWKLFFKDKIGITKKSSQRFVSPLYINIDTGVHSKNYI